MSHSARVRPQKSRTHAKPAEGQFTSQKKRNATKWYHVVILRVALS